MDIKQCIIVDLEKRGDKQMFITDKVTSIIKNRNGLWTVRFFASARYFNYNPSRLLYLTDPQRIDLQSKGLYVNKLHVTNVSELLRFTDDRYTFFLLMYNNGSYEYFESDEIYVTRTPINEIDGSVLDYLRKLAAETGLLSEDEENILSKQYDLIDCQRDNVPLAQYLGDKSSIKRYRPHNHVYYPFGCNSSQKMAVEAALSNQVSIIQGPPGTGKTQTILNIIANLLMKNKTVLVVSNNNSAIDNVAEKLQKDGIGFIVAKLGSVANKEVFINNQADYPEIGSWLLNDRASVKEHAKNSLMAVSKAFSNQVKQAQLKSEYDSLHKEATYNEILEHSSKTNATLNGFSSAKLMKLLNLYSRAVANGRKPGLRMLLKWSFFLRKNILNLLSSEPSEVIKDIEYAYYVSRQNEIEKELGIIESELKTIDVDGIVHDLKHSSLLLLRDRLCKRYLNRRRRLFAINEIKPNTEEFLKEYPVVLSTTYSAKSCISKDMVFDYVIMDEASQVDIKTGALALSCALNAVIVGDDRQLPNVISKEEVLAITVINSMYNIDSKYNALTHSFLQSCIETFKDAPVTLLREHYRCHPKIIEFCNGRFYNNELIAMTNDNGEKDVLQVIRTVPGNHAREHINQREIDTIIREVMPQYENSNSIGIITPYRSQAEAINKALGKDIASTVHKYQGRECDTIIMSMVDNSPTEFSDDPNLLNVAVSRAKTHLCIVTTGNDLPEDSNIGQLVRYVMYNNYDVRESKLCSVFDLLYKQYSAERLAYEKSHKKVSEYLSENLVYDLLKEAIIEKNIANTDILCHYPLSKLILNPSIFDEKERAFAESQFSHVDFLVYNSLTKVAIKAIEVDGWHYHSDKTVQKSRDYLKNQVLSKLGIDLCRISTTDIVNLETIIDLLSDKDVG